MAIDIYLQGKEALGVIDLAEGSTLCGLVDQTVLISNDSSKDGSIAGIFNTIKSFGKEYEVAFQEQIINQLYQERDIFLKSDQDYQIKKGLILDHTLKIIDSENYRFADIEIEKDLNSRENKIEQLPDYARMWYQNGNNPVFAHLTSKEGLKNINKEGLTSDSHVCAFAFPNESVYKKQFDETFQNKAGVASGDKIVVFQTDIVPRGFQKCGGSQPYGIFDEKIPLEEMEIMYSGTLEYKK